MVMLVALSSYLLHRYVQVLPYVNEYFFNVNPILLWNKSSLNLNLKKFSFQIEPFPNNGQSDIVFLVKTATTKNPSEIEYCVSNFLTEKINSPTPVFKIVEIMYKLDTYRENDIEIWIFKTWRRPYQRLKYIGIQGWQPCLKVSTTNL